MRRLINDGGDGDTDQVVNSGEGAQDGLDNALEDLGLNLGYAYYDDKEDLDIDWDEGQPPFCAGSRLHWGESCRGRSSCQLASFPVILWQHFIRTGH
jgi:hypothetical protein